MSNGWKDLRGRIDKILKRKAIFKVLMLAGVFSGVPAFAHDDGITGPHPDTAYETTANEATDTDSMKSFLLHFVAHQEKVVYENASEFRRALYQEEAGWSSAHVYPIVLDPEDGHVVIHGADRSVEDRRLNSPEDIEDPHVKALIDGAKKNDPEPFCMNDGMGRPTCAVTYLGRLLTRTQAVVIVGYDVRNLGERRFEELPGNDIRLPVRADQVTSRDDLKAFVEGVVDVYFIEFLIKRNCNFDIFGEGIQEQLQAMTTQQIKDFIAISAGSTQDVDILSLCNFLKPSLYRSVMGSEDGDWKSGSIYIFAMDDDQQRVVFNGLDRNLEDLDLKVFDESGQDVGQLIIDEVKGPDGGGFVEYCWDNPTYDGDEVRDENGNPIQGRAPGKSYKVSYVLDAPAALGLPESDEFPRTIFGSGIYPKEWPDTGPFANGGDGKCILSGSAETEPTQEPPVMDMVADVAGDGACAVAGAGDTTQGTVFNLVLIISALFFAVSFRNRTGRKRV